MPHNFHVHDVQFRVLEVDGEKPPSALRGVGEGTAGPHTGAAPDARAARPRAGMIGEGSRRRGQRISAVRVTTLAP
ncbi:hypothetical protein M8J73_23575 [Streptomyces neyagawaensis]|nr:hypothetical protein [Streptomyces neyagawaensis]